jgi:hypothetical protein
MAYTPYGRAIDEALANIEPLWLIAIDEKNFDPQLYSPLVRSTCELIMKQGLNYATHRARFLSIDWARVYIRLQETETDIRATRNEMRSLSATAALYEQNKTLYKLRARLHSLYGDRYKKLTKEVAQAHEYVCYLRRLLLNQEAGFVPASKISSVCAATAAPPAATAITASDGDPGVHLTLSSEIGPAASVPKNLPYIPLSKRVKIHD